MSDRLRVALGDHAHTRPLGSEDAKVRGWELTVEHPPMTSAFRAMIREDAYDVCEMAFSTVVAGLRYSLNFRAIPVFLVRSLPFDAAVRAAAADVEHPTDLHGRRVGIRALTGTAVLWVRGILGWGYGVEQDRVTWVVVDEDHLPGIDLPANIEERRGADLDALLATGELAAAVNPPGRGAGAVVPLLGDPAAAARRWLSERGVYPLNHVVVVRTARLVEDPDLGQKLFEAFTAAKAVGGTSLRPQAGLSPHEVARLVGPDLLPYGLEANRLGLEAAVTMAVEQQVLTHAAPVEDMFAPGSW